MRKKKKRFTTVYCVTNGVDTKAFVNIDKAQRYLEKLSDKEYLVGYPKGIFTMHVSPRTVHDLIKKTNTDTSEEVA